MHKKALIAALLLLTPAVSQAKTLEDLLVEKGVITKSEAANTAVSKSSSPAKVYYNEGTRIDFPDSGFGIKINTLIQTRYSFVDNDEDFGRFNRSSFDVHRARLYVSGTALHNEFRYLVEADLAGTEGDRGQILNTTDSANTSKLNDAWIIWSPCEGWDTQLGQFRTFTSRQYNTHFAKLQFADNSVVSDHFTLGRQAGAAQHVSLADGMVQVGGGIWNGESDPEGLNRNGVDPRVMGGAYLRINPTGKMDVYEEGDVNQTEELATSIGASYIYGKSNNVENPGFGVEKFNSNTANVDFNVKYQGFSLQGEGFFNEAGPEDRSFDHRTLGGYVQAGFFLEPQTWEIAGRYGYLDCDNGAGNGICSGIDKVNEAAGTINYYWWKHQMKAQLGYFFTNEDAIGSNSGSTSDANTSKWVFQLSSYF